MQIRRAELRDALGIAQVQVHTWHHAYAGVIPAAYLDGYTVQHRFERWGTILAEERPGAATWVAEEASRVIGFGSVLPSRDVPGWGELAALYVHPTRWGTGAGRALHEVALAQLVADGYPRATLWVLADNQRARRFYEQAGWAHDGVLKSDDYAGVAVPGVRLGRALGEDVSG